MNEKDQMNKAVLTQVEKLLGFRITRTKWYVADPNKFNGTPQAVLKDQSTLREELGIIIQQLDDLYYDNQLEYKTWQEMKKAVRLEYDKMVAISKSSKDTQQSNEEKHQNQVNYQKQSQNSKIPYNESDFIEFFDRRYYRNSKFKKYEAKEELIEKKAGVQRQVCRETLEEMLKEKYGIEDPDFDLEEILRQQEINELQRQQTEQIERTNRRL